MHLMIKALVQGIERAAASAPGASRVLDLNITVAAANAMQPASCSMQRLSGENLENIGK
jgi:hypothetical protein